MNTMQSVTSRRLFQHALLLIGALLLVGTSSISTDLSYGHIIAMGTPLILAVVLPYLITQRLWHEKAITFPFRRGRSWYKREIAYILFAGAAAYLLIPFYLSHTGVYHNWTVELGTSEIIRLFMGTNALGIWDELFFVGVCLALLRQHLPFVWANTIQAALWTLFLYELGFRGWGPIPIFLFALSQGFIFRKSKSLLYVISVHLTVDCILFLALIHMHHPHYLRIFITTV